VVVACTGVDGVDGSQMSRNRYSEHTKAKMVASLEALNTPAEDVAISLGFVRVVDRLGMSWPAADHLRNGSTRP